MPVDDEIDISDGAIMPFENGSVTTYLGRRSTASGHRIVRAGRVVGWIAEPAKGKVLLCGNAAKERLELLEMDQHRLVARVWTQSALGSVAEVVPEAFEHSADMRGLLGAGDSLERLLSRDLSAVLSNLVQRPEVRGGIAVPVGAGDRGVVDRRGEGIGCTVRSAYPPASQASRPDRDGRDAAPVDGRKCDTRIAPHRRRARAGASPSSRTCPRDCTPRSRRSPPPPRYPRALAASSPG